MNSQMVFIEEEEYQKLLLCHNQWHQLIKELDKISKELYNKPYYEGPFAIQVALEQIQNMYDEIKCRRQPWYKKI